MLDPPGRALTCPFLRQKRKILSNQILATNRRDFLWFRDRLGSGDSSQLAFWG
jgi:hypothetical protein